MPYPTFRAVESCCFIRFALYTDFADRASRDSAGGRRRGTLPGAFPSRRRPRYRLPVAIRFSYPDRPPRRLVLLAHGLNLRPGRLAALEAALREAGAVTGMLVLPGHGAGAARDELRAADAARLRARGQGALEEAAAVAARLGVPGPRIVAVSLGALVLLEAMLAVPRSPVAATDGILLSPALALHGRLRALGRLARMLPGGLPVPSLAERTGRVYAALPLAAYEALFELLASFERAVSRHPLRLPLRIYVDPADELISAAGLSRLVAEGALPHARVLTPPAGEPRGGRAHLLVDEATMGPTLWRDFTAAIGADGEDEDLLRGADPPE